MTKSKRKRTRKDSPRAAAFQPRLENLEERWMPGDTVLSGLFGQAVLQSGLGVSGRLYSKGGG